MSGNGKVFISHAHEDNDRCAPLLAALDAWGVDYWFDTQRMDAGHDLLASVQKAIAESDIFIRVGSKAALKSFWMDQELGAFMGLQAIDHRQGQANKRALIPFKLDPEYQFQPVELGKIYIDASDTQQHKRWVEELRRALQVNARDVNKDDANEIVVDCMKRGDFATIAEAIGAASYDARIVVRPGVYHESLVIDKPLEIVGEGNPGQVLVEVSGQDVIKFSAPNGRISNLTVRRAEGDAGYGVDIVQGYLELDGCDISSESLACVSIHGAATAYMHGNRVHHGKQSGIFIYGRGLGILHDNEIDNNSFAGVQSRDGGNAILCRNRIHDGKASGVYVFETGLGTLYANEIFANARNGVQVASKGNAALLYNHIHDNRESGVYINKEGRGTLEDNVISANGYSGVPIKDHGRAELRRNRIKNNSSWGIRIRDNSGGVFEENILQENTKGAWDISPDSEPNVRRERNQE